jgi:hypothetical protein
MGATRSNMPDTINSSITKGDLIEFEATIKKVVDDAKNSGVQKEYLQLLERIVDALTDIRLVVEFDHEQRIRALEEYIQSNF